jgi:stage V sporulation protein R
MELVNQRTKFIMEGCKERARSAGLRFDNETLEYIVTNRDLIDLTPKLMIPTLYDYWVHDVEVLREKGRYELYPSNPYETVINTRPAISFYNDNNADWLNVMIFYHVLAHIDFFQNNTFFRNTWDFDFTGQALSDKRLVAKLRSEKGRWVDYVVEFARGIDNLAGYYSELASFDRAPESARMASVDYYFDVYLQTIRRVSPGDYIKELERYNQCVRDFGDMADQAFFTDIYAKNPEFKTYLTRKTGRRGSAGCDVLQYLMQHSEFLKKHDNTWINSLLEVVRNTSLFFQPQIRTKIMNEGWASYWHEKLFLSDDRILGHEVDFARAHAMIASLPRVGLNPYALGMRLFDYIEEIGNKGRCSMEFKRLNDIRKRNDFDRHTGNGNDLIFQVRKDICDSMFIGYIDQDFMTRHDLFVTGRRLDRDRMVWEYYVKSRKAPDYRDMLARHLYHPPWIEIEKTRTTGNTLYLYHHFEGKPLVHEYISNTMLGIEYLWGGPVMLETSEVVPVQNSSRHSRNQRNDPDTGEKGEVNWKRVLYTMKDRTITRKEL